MLAYATTMIKNFFKKIQLKTIKKYLRFRNKSARKGSQRRVGKKS